MYSCLGKAGHVPVRAAHLLVGGVVLFVVRMGEIPTHPLESASWNTGADEFVEPILCLHRRMHSSKFLALPRVLSQQVVLSSAAWHAHEFLGCSSRTRPQVEHGTKPCKREFLTICQYIQPEVYTTMREHARTCVRDDSYHRQYSNCV